MATAVARALDDDGTVRGTFGLGGPAALTLRQMAERILSAMKTQRVIVGMPTTLIRPLVALAQRVVPNPPVTTSLLDLLGIDNTVRDNALTSVFGVDPVPFAPEELLYLRDITAGEALRSLFSRA